MRPTFLLAVSLLVAAASGAPTQCETCQWATSQLQALLGQQGSVAQLVKYVQESGCKQTGILDEQCSMVAETLIPEVMKWLVRPETPGQLCSAASVCGGANLPGLTELGMRTFARDNMRDDAMCSMCEHVTDAAMALKEPPMDASSFETHALVACEDMPGQLSATCARMVHMYAPQIAAFADRMNSWSSCAMAGLCTSQVLGHLPVPALPHTLVEIIGQLRHSAEANSNVCDMCRLTVIELNTLVSNPSVQQQITNYTKTLCDSLGSSAADTCKLYVDLYGPAVFILLKQYLQPDPICQGATLKPAHLRGQDITNTQARSQLLDLTEQLPSDSTTATSATVLARASLSLDALPQEVTPVPSEEGDQDDELALSRLVSTFLDKIMYGDAGGVNGVYSKPADSQQQQQQQQQEQEDDEDENIMPVDVMTAPQAQEENPEQTTTVSQGTQTDAITSQEAPTYLTDDVELWTQQETDAWGGSYYDFYEPLDTLDTLNTKTEEAAGKVASDAAAEEYKQLEAAAQMISDLEELYAPVATTSTTSTNTEEYDEDEKDEKDQGGSYYEIYYDALSEEDQKSTTDTASSFKGDAIDPTASASGTTAAFNPSDVNSWEEPLDDTLDIDRTENPMDDIFMSEGVADATPYEVLQKRAQALFAGFDDGAESERVQQQRDDLQIGSALAAAYNSAVQQLHSAFSAVTQSVQMWEQPELEIAAPDIRVGVAAEAEVRSSNVLQMGRQEQTGSSRRMLRRTQS